MKNPTQNMLIDYSHIIKILMATTNYSFICQWMKDKF